MAIHFPGEDAEIDFGRAFVVGRLIYVSNHGTFTIDNSFKHIQPAHCDPGNWVATIAAGFNGEGVLTAILEHDVTPQFFKLWDGTEHLDCTVEIKDIADVTTDRAQHAIERLEDDWDRIAEKMYKDHLNMNCGPGVHRLASRLPSEKIFLDLPPLDALPLVEGPLPDWTAEEQRLTDDQRQAITNFFDYPFSCVKGPPGASKSTLVRELVRSILRNTDRQIMICTSKQENVEDLTRLVGAMMEQDGTADDLVRIFSHPQSTALMYPEHADLDSSSGSPISLGVLHHLYIYISARNRLEACRFLNANNELAILGGTQEWEDGTEKAWVRTNEVYPTIGLASFAAVERVALHMGFCTGG